MRVFEGFQHGVNFGGWLSQCVSYEKEHFETFIQEKDVEQVASWGLDHVRVPVDFDIIEDGKLNMKEEGLAYIDNCIAWCKKYGLHMILDLHKTYGYSFDSLDHGDMEKFFYDEELQAHFIDLWRTLAKRYGKMTDVLAFELLNEVVMPTVADAWNDIIVKTCKAIREYAPDMYIIYGGVCYNSVSSVPMLVAPIDDKIVYNFHCYEPIIFTHQAAYWVDGMPDDFKMVYPASLEEYREKSSGFSKELTSAIYQEDLTGVDPSFFEKLFVPATETATKMDVPLYCGEYGVIDRAPTADTVRWLKDIQSVFEKYHIGRALWNYKDKDYGLVDEHYADVRDEIVKLL